ncbi:MAG: class A beta-lactamase [Vicinamibacterales bacterium]
MTRFDHPTRRAWMAAIAAAAVAPLEARRQDPTAAALAAAEKAVGGRLGVGILDTGSGRLVGQRLDERFAMCSTFKLPLAAMVLREAAAGRLSLDERIVYTKADMQSYAPVTSQHLAEGHMTVAALAEAAQTTSDNTAANLLLRRLGGPAAFTERLRAAGDTVTRLDRLEPTLNVVVPGDDRDTTTPRAMATVVAKYLTTDYLTTSSRDMLIGWMEATATGQKRLRAGFPAGWRAGDKTGTAQADAMTDKVNDIAIAWPPGRAPIVVTAYYDSARKTDATQPADEAALAAAGRAAAAWVTR